MTTAPLDRRFAGAHGWMGMGQSFGAAASLCSAGRLEGFALAMLTRVRRQLGLLTVIMAAGLIVATPSLGARIAGVVTDAAGKPIAGAQIAAQSSSTAVVSMMTSTDKNGRYCIANLPPGSYDLVLEPPFGFSGGSFIGARASSSGPNKPEDVEGYHTIAPLRGYAGAGNRLPDAHDTAAPDSFRTTMPANPPGLVTPDFGDPADFGDIGVADSYVGPEGLTVNWSMTDTGIAVALVLFGAAAAKERKLCGEP